MNETQVEEPPQTNTDGPITGTTEEIFGEEGQQQTEGGQQQQTTTEGGEKAATAAKPPTAEDIAAAVQRGTEAAAARAQQPAERQYTQQELDQIFKVWNPTEDLITKLLGGGPDAVKAMVEIRQGLLQ